MNHELGRTFPALPPGVDARISRVVINGKNRDVQEAHYAFTGAEGFERMDVQAHPPAIPPPVGFPLAPQPGAVSGPDGQPVPNTGFGEDGQVMAVYVPNSS